MQYLQMAQQTSDTCVMVNVTSQGNVVCVMTCVFKQGTAAVITWLHAKVRCINYVPLVRVKGKNNEQLNDDKISIEFTDFL